MKTATGRLRKTWQRVRTEPRFGRNALILLCLIVLGVTSGVVIVNNQGSGLTTWPWTDRFQFEAVFDEAHGVAAGQGQGVRIAGVTVGTIEKSEVSEDGKAVLSLGVDPQHRIYDNASLVLRPKSPLNEMYVTIDPGGPPGEPIEAGQRLPVGNTETPVTVDRVTEHLDENTRDALAAVINEADVALTHASEELAGGVAGTDKVMRDLRPVVEELHERQDTLAELVSALATISRSIGEDNERLTRLAADLEESLSVLSDRSHPLDESIQQLPEFTSQLRRATDAVQELSGQLDPTLDNVREASDDLPGALAQLRSTVEEADTVIDKANPVVEQLKPVAADLRPVLSDTRAALGDLTDISAQLDPVTAALVPYLEDLRAFTYNTASLTSLRDGNAPVIRAHLVAAPDTIPLLDDLPSQGN
ncbi:phospholipid/cholesterol/gamma-HCH transport system substrate-binding protein [Haloechinothrix alba]|uniref:Phospholipid/cholesterol/gamma-HCH transport system substrate-binding protein n=1 Tax=Haloechinothrix alba TaxID=664784 RepID=A0A238ZHV4_9PSEU|nr:MlaD family protein [Haloechinothrix alba]SNR82273.1 phospholipid/cholesterol/gamma-HCH transport system substrate-binding protein [Haloechinothrix alba]